MNKMYVRLKESYGKLLQFFGFRCSVCGGKFYTVYGWPDIEECSVCGKERYKRQRHNLS